MNPSKVEVSLAETKVSLPKGLTPWILGIKAKIGGRILQNLNSNTDGLDRYLECAEIQELPGAYLCCSFYQQDMNDAFTRMGIFMGAGRGVKEGTLQKQDDPVLLNYKKLVAGHNLPGPVISGFYQSLQVEKDSSLVANSFESEFQKKFLSSSDVSSKRDQFYVIGFSIQNMKSYQSVLTHEIFHAKYFLDTTYRDVVNRFWNESVEAGDKAKITSTIGQAYNTDKEELVIDEFQAYLLQASAHQDRMKHFVERYQALLANELASHGVQPLLVE